MMPVSPVRPSSPTIRKQVFSTETSFEMLVPTLNGRPLMRVAIGRAGSSGQTRGYQAPKDGEGSAIESAPAEQSFGAIATLDGCNIFRRAMDARRVQPYAFRGPAYSAAVHDFGGKKTGHD